MIENAILPQDLANLIGSESRDFVVKANRAQPLSQSIALIVFGFIWTSLTAIFAFFFFAPFIKDKLLGTTTEEFSTNDSDSFDLIPAVFIVFFILIGITLLILGIRSLFTKGGYFVGTPKRLIIFQKNSMRSIDWEQFSGDITVNGDDQKGNISMQLRTGKMASSKNQRERFVPDVIYISEIPNVSEIQKLCWKRINENDPSPAN
ncbi:MAG: hypothetical protein V4608_09135 [Bacteroidota bacterium]